MKKVESPSRRRFLKGSGAAAVMGGLLGPNLVARSGRARQGSGWRRNPRSKHPNILLMLVDEMRYPPVYEARGAEKFRREYLRTEKKLRAHGVEFHRHYVASTACAPSRASIFTGQYPSLHGVTQTTGAAKAAADPDVYWLETNSVPTLGDYFRAGGYRTFYKGKWHVSHADLEVPGTTTPITSYDDLGQRDAEKEELYLEADRLDGYGFSGWIGPEPHGAGALNSGSSPAEGQGRDIGFGEQVVELIDQLDVSGDDDPWLMVASMVNPHDIALWGFASMLGGQFDFSIEDIVPAFKDLFDVAAFEQTLMDDLSTKPSCQESYQVSYNEWMQGIPPEGYFRFYYQLHKDVDEILAGVYKALHRSRFFDDTIIVFTSDHGDLLGSHHYMHQKWYQAYDEAIRVPLIISSPNLVPQPKSIYTLTSHVDLVPTLMGLAGLKPAQLLDAVAEGHSDPVPLVGRDLSKAVLRGRKFRKEPIYFMTDDDPSRGLNQENFYGIAYNSVSQPNHLETVIVEIDGDVWKYSRYFDNTKFWSDPTVPKDVVIGLDDSTDLPGETEVTLPKSVKYIPLPDEYEMYNVTRDPMELDNLVHVPAEAAMRIRLAAILQEQRSQKRLSPMSG